MSIGLPKVSAVERGAAWEEFALHHLQQQGLILLDRNYRCRMGELDLIMRDGNTVVFIEVRYRKSNAFGSAAESVGAHKQARLLKAASHYLQKNNFPDEPACRFDVVAISGQKGESLEWIKDAFGE